MAQYDNLDDYNWLMGEIIRHETEQAAALGKMLYQKFFPKSVLDVGCGPGIYLLPFKEAGSKVQGIDGASGAGKYLDANEFSIYDIRQGMVSYGQYDMVLCIEVAEHVPAEHADKLMDIVVGNCKPTGAIFFCAAHPGQGGEGHVNEQPQDYWMQKFHNRHCMLHPFHDYVREQIMTGYAYEHCGWLRWNSFMMKRV